MSDKSCISESAFQGDRLERQVEPQSGKSGQKVSSLSVVFSFASAASRTRATGPGPTDLQAQDQNESSGRSQSV